MSSTSPTQPKARVVGLHRVPYDKAAIRRHVDRCGEEWEPQFIENWKNAWIVVIEFAGNETTEIPWNQISLGKGGNAQVPWLETTIDESSSRIKGAFFLHYLDELTQAGERLYCGQQELPLPAVTPASDEILSQIQYESPD